MEIHPLANEEVPTLLGLMRALQEDDPWSVPFEGDRVGVAVETLLAHPDYGQAWLVRDHGRVVGYAVMSFDYSLEYGGRNAWVDEIFIRVRRKRRPRRRRYRYSSRSQPGKQSHRSLPPLRLRRTRPASHDQVGRLDPPQSCQPDARGR